MRSLIRAGVLLQGRSLSPVRDAWLTVDDGTISEVGVGPVTGPFDIEEDLRDCVVMPGLIDTHVHLQLEPGPDHDGGRAAYTEARRAGRLPLIALAQARRALLAGLTTVRDLGGDMSILAVRDAIAAGEPGPRLLVAGLPITTTGGHCHWLGEARSDSPEEVRKMTRWLVEQGVDVVKIMASGGNMTPESNALQPQYSASDLAVAVGEAHRLRRRIVAHALNVEAIRNCVEAGVDSVDHCSWQLPDGSLGYVPEIGQRLVETGTWVGVTGSGILRILLGEGKTGRDELRRRLMGHREVFRQGGRVSVHSDAGVRFTPVERFDLALRVMMVGLDVAPRDVLAAVTSGAAESIGLGRQTGAIATGRWADLLVLDRDPLADLSNVRSVRAAFKQGVKLVADGRLAVPERPEAADPWLWVKGDGSQLGPGGPRVTPPPSRVAVVGDGSTASQELA